MVILDDGQVSGPSWAWECEARYVGAVSYHFPVRVTAQAA